MIFDNTTDLTCYFKMEAEQIYVACEAPLKYAAKLENKGYSFLNGSKTFLKAVIKDHDRKTLVEFQIPPTSGTVYDTKFPIIGADIVEIRR